MKKMLYFVMIVLFTLVVPVGQLVLAQEDDSYSSFDFRDSMLDVMRSIEGAAGIEPKASKAISEISDEVMEMIFESMSNKKQFMTSAQQIVDRIESSKGTSRAALARIKTTALGFSPNYPEDVNYSWALVFGLVDSPDDRCGGEGLVIYESALAGAEEALAIGDAACAVAGCDPTGIVCVSACGAVEALKLAVHAARFPLDVCAAHSGNVDSAEIEAGYENGVTILDDLAAEGDELRTQLNTHDKDIKAQLNTHDTDINAKLNTHDTNINAKLSTHDSSIKAQLNVHNSAIKAQLNLHDTNIKAQLNTHDTEIKDQLNTHDTDIKDQLNTHDTDIKALLAEILATQQEIIKLLKTPEGKRPGWNKDGY